MNNPNSREAKRQIGARIDAALIKEIRILAIHEERRPNELIDEALRDLLKKYREKSKGK
jgi:hypothetical protein